MEWMLNNEEIRKQVEAMPIEQRVLRLERYLETQHMSNQIFNTILEMHSNNIDELHEKVFNGQENKDSPKADRREAKRCSEDREERIQGLT